MPSTKNLRHLNFCFPNSTSKQESPSPSPRSPIIAPSTSSNHIHQNPNHNNSNNNHNLSTPSSSSLNMIKNFNSLYDPSLSFNHDHSLRFSSLSSTITTTITSSFDSEPEIEPEPADFAAAFSSQRFFFSSPGQSNSLVKYNNKNPNSNSPSSSLPFVVNTGHQFDRVNNNNNNNNNNSIQKKEDEDVVFNGSVAVPTYSPDPYLDFRRSMQEMVEARPELMDVKSNWNVLHELLLCYLALNPKSTHKFIIGAFADLLVSLMPF